VRRVDWVVSHLDKAFSWPNQKEPSIPEGSTIELLQPAELETLPDGTVTYTIHGVKAVKGEDNIDGDTRGGFLAYGILKA
jgi:hypothetical protein